MKTRVLITLGVFLGLSGGIILGARPFCYGHGQEKEERPKFYALRVVSEKSVQNAKDSLGASDGRYAEILPGGQLVLQMEKGFCLFVLGSNQEEGVEMISGSVVGKGGADTSLELWSPWQAREGKYYCGWVAVGLSAKGFSIPIDLGLYYDSKGITPPFIGNTGVNTVRITNLGTKSLFVDAVIGLDMEVERK
ncbi:MAG: hypothetical protein ABSG73_15120 [Candidatus Aminicenantales bacterium]